MRLKYGLLRLITWFFLMVARHLPEGLGYFLAQRVADLFLFLQPGRRRVIERNLLLCFGDELSPALRRQIAYRSARHLALTAMEVLYLLYSPPSKVGQMVVEQEGVEELKAAYGQGRGIVGLGMHYGNWEVSGAYTVSQGIRLVAVGREQRDEFFTGLIFPLREKLGIENVMRGRRFSSKLVRALREGAMLGLLADQNGGADGIFVPFFGRPASTVSGPAVLHLKFGSPLFLCVARRLAPGRFRFIARPVRVGGLEGLSREEQVRRVTEIINRAYEEVIRQDPEQWVWLHRRFKTQPEGAPDPYADL